MWYWLVDIILAVWVFSDARQRRVASPGAWAAGVFFLMIVFLPLHVAKRPLKAGEVREGGTAWNFIKVFVIIWTVLMAGAGFSGLVAAGNTVSNADPGAAQAGAAVGTVLGLGLLMVLWFMIAVGALVLGLLMKKSSIVEKGPTGPLADASGVLA